MRPDPQPIRLIDQQIDPLPALQHPLDVLRHDPPHIVDLVLRVRDRVLLAPLGGSIPDHQLLERKVEISGAVGGQGGEIGGVGGVAREELFLDLDEVAEGDAAAETAGGDDEEGEAAGGGGVGRVFGGGIGDVVDEVLVVGVG